MTTIEKIGRGLDARERNEAGRKPKLSGLAAAPRDIAAVRNLMTSVTQKRDRLRAIAGLVTDAVETFRAQKTAEFAKIGFVQNDEGKGRTDQLGENRRRSMVAGEVRRFEREYMAKSEAERLDLSADLTAAKDSLDLVRDHYSSPVTILMRETLASEKRSVYAANLREAGPVELDTAFREAVMTGNSDLAAAAMTRLDAMGKEPRKLVNFRKSEVAEALAGEQWAEAQELIGMADYAIAGGELAAKQAAGAKIDPNQKIKIGMMPRELEAKLGRPISGDSQGDDGESQKVETFEERLDRLYPAVKGSGAAMGGRIIGENTGGPNA